MRTAILIVPVLALFAAGCHQSSDGRSQAEVLPSGLVRVTNSGEPGWTSETAWRLEEDLRLGNVGGEGPEQFSRIGAILADSEGYIYVLDLFSQEIRVFQPDGTFSHVVGGRGEGPGEFRDASAMMIGPGDTLWVIDPHRLSRYSAFDRNGGFLRSHTRRIQGYAFDGGFTPEGRLIDWGLTFPDEGPDVVAGARIVYRPMVLSADFEKIDSLPSLEFTQQMVAGGTLPQLYFAERLVAYQDRRGSLWFARSGEYRIFRRSLEGDTTVVLSLAVEPAPVQETDRMEVKTRFRDRPELADAYLEGLPATKPVIHRIFGDGAGHVFVVPEIAGFAAGTVLDVFREDGEYLGRTNLPTPIGRVGPFRSLAPVYAAGDYIYCVVADENDVHYLSRLKIRRPPPTKP